MSYGLMKGKTGGYENEVAQIYCSFEMTELQLKQKPKGKKARIIVVTLKLERLLVLDIYIIAVCVYAVSHESDVRCIQYKSKTDQE